jgi:YHS domain-containing protein
MENREHPPSEFDDIMVKDPFCNTYFPKRSGVHLHYKGQDLYFCKTECRDGFIAAQKENHGEKNN